MIMARSTRRNRSCGFDHHGCTMAVYAVLLKHIPGCVKAAYTEHKENPDIVLRGLTLVQIYQHRWLLQLILEVHQG